MRMNLLTRLTCSAGEIFSKENFDIRLTHTCGPFSIIRNFDKRATFTDTIPPATIAVADTDPNKSAIILMHRSAHKRLNPWGPERLNQTGPKC